MTRLLLTADLGNSLLKLCLWDRPGLDAPRDSESFAADGSLVGEVSAWLDARPAPAAVALCAVTECARERTLAELLEPFGLVAGGGHGLAIACDHPETIGDDRLFAARGALELVGGPCLVVDAGTALTVDAVQVEDGGRGVFLGGAIAPGPRLLARALAEGGARLPTVEDELVPGAPALGRHTRAALVSGVVSGFRGAARELCREVAREAGIERAPLVITGGARRFLDGGPPLAEDVREDPWLVHRGLLCALEG